VAAPEGSGLIVDLKPGIAGRIDPLGLPGFAGITGFG
jgi:hypothetical protein